MFFYKIEFQAIILLTFFDFLKFKLKIGQFKLDKSQVCNSLKEVKNN